MHEYHISYLNSWGLKCAFRMIGTSDNVAEEFERKYGSTKVIKIRKFNI